MALSTFDSIFARTRVPHPVCPYCGHCVEMRPRQSFIETVLRVLAGLVLAIMLVPLAVIVWRSCADFLSNRVSHSILYHPLEDWTHY